MLLAEVEDPPWKKKICQIYSLLLHTLADDK